MRVTPSPALSERRGSSSIEVRNERRVDELAWVAPLVRALDDAVAIPGTNIRFGLDPILGLLAPGVGDALTGATSVALLVAGVRRRVPTVILLRMLLNVGVDVVVGSIPAVGDLFDVAWRANRKNLELLELHQGRALVKPRWQDYAVVTAAVVFAVASVALPIALLVWVVGAIV